MNAAAPLWAGLILAAGRSSRMGTQHKLLEDLNGQPVIRRVVDHARAARLHALLLVTGYRADEVGDAAGDIQTHYNPDYQSGMASSLTRGLAAVPEDCAGVFVLLGDMPFIKPDHINAMIDAINAAPHAKALVPVVDGKWAHPVAFRRCLFAEVMTVTGDKGARAVLMAHKDDVLLWPSNDRSLLFDLDTPQALALARNTLGTGQSA